MTKVRSPGPSRRKHGGGVRLPGCDCGALFVELLRAVAAGDRTELVYDDIPLAPGS